MKTYVEYVYEIIKNKTEGMDTIYKDYIIQIVGVHGFNALHGGKIVRRMRFCQSQRIVCISGSKRCVNR